MVHGSGCTVQSRVASQYLACKSVEGILPVSEASHNLREIIKQLLLLEDHLFHPSKYCPECITKHLLMVEAFADEGATLDHHENFDPLFEKLSELARQFQSEIERERVPMGTLAMVFRRLRKGLMQWDPAG